MKKLLAIFTLLLASNALFAQDTVFVRYNIDQTGEKLTYGMDTIIFETEVSRQMLFGTDIIPGTYNQMTCLNYGLYLEKVTKSDCMGHGDQVELMKDHINSIVKTDTSIIVDFTLVANCCHEFLCDASVDEKGVLNLLYTGYGTYCACNCCFGLIYHFSIEQLSDEQQKIKAVMLDNDPKTLKTL